MSRSAGADRTRRARPLWIAAGVWLLVGGIAAVAADPPVRGVPRPVDPSTNPSTDAKVQLGRRLFFETRLSTDGTVSCATCHASERAFTDGRKTAVGVNEQVGPRNSPTLLNAALMRHLFWDGRAPTLEEQAREPFLNPIEMGWTDEAAFHRHLKTLDAQYGADFEAVFGSRTMTRQRLARAIAAFERTLLAGDSPFDRWWHGEADALTDAQKRGYELFVKDAGCAQCHSIRQSFALFTDDDFHNTGAGEGGAGEGTGKDDIGRKKVTGEDEDHGKFRTPTLRNVALTAPYMHDGSLATLEEVVDFYVDGGAENPHLSPLMRPLELDEEQRKDLVAFLHALTSTETPQLEECEKLLREGYADAAFDAYTKEVLARPGDVVALSGLARSAIALDDPDALDAAERCLRAVAWGADAPDPELLLRLGDVSNAMAMHEDAMAQSRQEDALAAWARIRKAGIYHADAAVREAKLLEALGRVDEGIAVLAGLLETGRRDDVVGEVHARLLYRRGWRAFDGRNPSEEARADLRAAADELDGERARGRDLIPVSMLYRAYARHWLGERDAARDAYVDAIAQEEVAEKALRGLRNLLARDLPSYRAQLQRLTAEHPRSPTLLYFAGYEYLQERKLDEAEAAFRKLLDDHADWPAGGVHLHLAQVARARGDRAEAVDHYAVALALAPQMRAAITEFEQYVLGHPLDGLDDVAEMLTEFDRLLDAGPDDLRFQILVRNNMAFLLREVASSYTSRGPARVQTLVEGAPPEALEIAKRSLELYEEATALIPEDARDLPFDDRWIYAGVLNDTGLMMHYLEPLQDLARAEALYLRSFDLTDGAYQDTYFYNLQFLYGFELDGRADEWLELARVAKDAILKEDPDSPTGYSPDLFKRQAAQRDFERLSARRP